MANDEQKEWDNNIAFLTAPLEGQQCEHPEEGSWHYSTWSDRLMKLALLLSLLFVGMTASRHQQGLLHLDGPDSGIAQYAQTGDKR